MRSRVTTLVVLSAFIAGVQLLAAGPAAAMDDNGTDACLPMPGFPGLGTDSDGFCDPLTGLAEIHQPTRPGPWARAPRLFVPRS